MEIRNLNSFLRAAALGNFTQAAKELGYSQANVSAQIRQLEEEVGAPLFDRIGRTVRLTACGEELLPYARRIVSTAIQMENLLKDERAVSGTVRIGMVESLFGLTGEPLLDAFHRRFPLVRTELSVDASASLKELVRRGSLDEACIIDDALLPQEWQILKSLGTDVAVVANPAHALVGKRGLSIRALSGQELIMMEASAPYSIRFQALLAQADVTCSPFLTLQSSETALHLVEKGLYLSVLPRYVAARAEKEGRVAFLDIPELSIPQRVQVILHRDKAPMPHLRAFASIMEECLQAQDTQGTKR